MVGSHWLIGALVGVMALHALVMYWSYRFHERNQSNRPDSAGADRVSVDTDEAVVECPNCGTTNERRYRYCRFCVTELPLTREFEQETGGPLGRVMR